MIDPAIAAVVLAFVFAGALSLPARIAARRAERFCVACGRRVLLGVRTCECDH